MIIEYMHFVLGAVLKGLDDDGDGLFIHVMHVFGFRRCICLPPDESYPLNLRSVSHESDVYPVAN